MPPLVNASTTAAFSSSGRPANSVRLGAALKIIQSIAARPSIATMPMSGRLLITAGWARKARTPPAAPRRGEAAAGARTGRSLAVVSLISHRHAHDVFVGGKEAVPDLQGRLETDRSLL